ncbi:hypothetical protein QL285_048327 [Trifolium repens]|nr:hypothetical protein QL285_048327 [Trifolium repens]
MITTSFLGLFNQDLYKNKVDKSCDYRSPKTGALKDAETYQRIWNVLHMGGDSNLVERILCSTDVVDKSCDYCSRKTDALKACLSSIHCNHKSTVDLIWGRLFVLQQMFDIKEVASRVLSIVRESFDGNSDALFCNLGDMLLFGNHERLKVGAEIEEIYLDYSVKQLILCFSPPNNWKYLFGSMIDLLEICVSDYHIFIENKKEKNWCKLMIIILMGQLSTLTTTPCGLNSKSGSPGRGNSPWKAKSKRFPYKQMGSCMVVRFLGENKGTLIDAFTIGVDHDWREIHQSTGNNDWMFLIEVNTLFNIPPGVLTMQLPICLYGNLLPLAFHCEFLLPGDPLFEFNPHEVVVNVVTGHEVSIPADERPQHGQGHLRYPVYQILVDSSCFTTSLLA